MSRKKISLFLPDMRGGGAERVNLLLLQEFIAKGHDVDLVLLRKEGALLDHVPAEVRVIELQVDRVRQGFMPLVRYLRECRPDAFLVSMWPLTTMSVVAKKWARFSGRLLAWEHSTLSRSPQGRGISGILLRVSMRWINSNADHVVGVSNGVIDDLRSLGLPRDVGKVIHNPVSLGGFIDVPGDWKDHAWFKRPYRERLLAVGSLKPAKDYPTMFRSVKKVIDSGRHVCLLVLGSGPLENELNRLIQSLGLEENVYFGGFVTDPGPFYRAAGLFVISSAWEGFGNVIVEALAAGTPVVSTDCRSGPAEILENGRYGRLVPVGDDTALAEAICQSLVANHDLDALRARAADFSPEKIGEEYLKVLTSRESV